MCENWSWWPERIFEWKFVDDAKTFRLLVPSVFPLVRDGHLEDAKVLKNVYRLVEET